MLAKKISSDGIPLARGGVARESGTSCAYTQVDAPLCARVRVSMDAGEKRVGGRTSGREGGEERRE